MRMGARKRGFLWAVLRSKGSMCLQLLALLLGLCQLEIAGRSVGSFVAELAISPADARRASTRSPGIFNSDPRHTSAPLQLPAFAPSGRVPAFALTPQMPAFGPAARTPVFGTPAAIAPSSRQPVTAPPFGAVPSGRPSAAADVRKPSGFAAGSNPTREESRIGKVAKRDGEAPQRIARASLAETREAHGGWNVMVRPATGLQPGAASLVSGHPTALPPPVQSQAQPAGRAHTPFNRLVEKLSSRSREASQPARPAAAPPATKPGESPTAGAGGARTAVRRLGGRPAMGGLLPPVGSFRTDEVLAINLSPEGLGRVRDGSYRSSSASSCPISASPSRG